MENFYLTSIQEIFILCGQSNRWMVGENFHIRPSFEGINLSVQGLGSIKGEYPSVHN
jgi:hypothetical protein